MPCIFRGWSVLRRELGIVGEFLADLLDQLARQSMSES